MAQITSEELNRNENLPVYDRNGDQIGHVGEFWVDESGRPEWLKIGTGFLGMKNLFVPVQGGELRDDGFHIPYTRDQVESSPEFKDDDFTPEYERELYGAYGLEQPRAETGTRTGDTVTRSEEELAVGKERVEAGTARLRKYVTSEPVEMDVELQRETARVVREPVDEVVDEAAIGEDEVEVPLSAERPVVAKQTVAKERVGLETDVETERQTVRDEVRKEHVEVEGDDR